MESLNKKRGRKPDGNEKKISVYAYLTPEILELITKEAAKKNQTVSKIINQTIEEFFAK